MQIRGVDRQRPVGDCRDVLVDQDTGERLAKGFDALGVRGRGRRQHAG
jgi:hypothetical protein